MLTFVSRLRRAVTGLTIVALAAVAALSIGSAVPSEAVTVPAAFGVGVKQATTAPNVLIILTDDQRAGTEWGMTSVRTRLIDRGVRFTNATVPTSVCCPSRAALLSGRYAHETGVWDNQASSGIGGWPAFNRGGAEQSTIATALDDLGYQTGYFGKYLNDTDRMPLGYRPPGWDFFHGFRNPGNGYTRFTTTDGSLHNDVYSTDYFGDATLQFLSDTDPDEPFFTVYAPFAPHHGYDAGPYKGLARSSGNYDAAMAEIGWPNAAVNRRDLTGKPHWFLDWPTSDIYDTKTPLTVQEVPEAQMDTLQGVDANVDRILTHLEVTGRLQNTLVIYTSDNGYVWGENRLRGKYTPHATSSDVPLVVRWDAGPLQAGTVEDRLVAANLDVAATVLAAAGTTLDPATDGYDLLDPALIRKGLLLEAVTWRVINRPPYCGYRTKDWMFARYSTGEEELYDYRTDPLELRNLAYSSDPALVRQTTRMRSAAKRGCSPMPRGFRWTRRTPVISQAEAMRPENLTNEWAHWWEPVTG